MIKYETDRAPYTIIYYSIMLLGLRQHLMSMADSLTNTNPDSAVIYLNKLKDHIETAPRSVQMYYQLLCIKANDRAYIPHSSDSGNQIYLQQAGRLH